MKRLTFNMVLDILGARIVRQNSRSCLVYLLLKYLLLDCIVWLIETPLTIGPTFNVGKSTVTEAVQHVVGALYELWDDHIKFPESLAEFNASIQS